jgi:PD-(D/E)XK endonuclease
VLTTDQKGAAAELAIAHAAADLGVGVFKPLTDGERYDLIFDFRPRLMRVQCKTAVLKGDVLAVPCYSARRSRTGLVKRYYSASEIDAIAAYCVELRRSFFIPIDEIAGRSGVQLRLEPSRNNQRLGINWAKDFALEARLIALLGP